MEKHFNVKPASEIAIKRMQAITGGQLNDATPLAPGLFKDAVAVGNLNINVLGARATLATEGAWVADAVVPTKLQRFKQREVFMMATSPRSETNYKYHVFVK